MADPQSFNRYAYTQNDPVNFVDPSGLNLHEIGHSAAAEDDGDVIRIYTWAPSWNWGWGGGGGGGGRIQPVRPLDPIDGGGGGGTPPNPAPLTPGQVGTLRGDIQNLLKKPDCSNFVQGLLSTVAGATQRPLYNTDPLKTFDAVAGTKGGGLFLAPGQGASGYAYGSIAGGDAKITFDILFAGFGFVRGLVGLHEVLHESTGIRSLYSDRELGLAAYQVATAQGYKDVPKPPATNDVLANSQYYNDRLFKACSPNQHK